MKLKKPILITQQKLSQLESVKGKMLLREEGTTFIIVNSFETEEKNVTITKKRFLRSPVTTTETLLYLTDAEFFIYNQVDEYWAIVSENNINRLLMFYNLMKMRTDYKRCIKTPLEKLGFEMVKVKITNYESKRI
jgi:hypothetical protein